VAAGTQHGAGCTIAGHFLSSYFYRPLLRRFYYLILDILSLAAIISLIVNFRSIQRHPG
jgi:hypothetical protein